MDSPEKFISAVQKGVATVEFRKIGTDELRIMPCTLNSEIAGKEIAVKDFDPASHNFVVWCLDKDAWRSFRVNTVERWYEGYPEGHEL
jgi:hypothetical protein